MLRRTLGLSFAITALFSVTEAAAQNDNTRGGHGESCRARVDCSEGLVCVDNKCLEPGEERVSAPPPPPSSSGDRNEADLYDQQVPWRGSRIGIYYMITPPVAGNLRSLEPGHSVGIESASRLFAELRYRATFGYAAAIGRGVTIHGFRADMLSLGYTITAAKSSAVRFGIEPIINLINLETYFSPGGGGGTLFMFSSGWSVAAILGFGSGHGYINIEPIGMDFRWLAAGGGVTTQADIGVQWRGRVSVGIAF